MNENKQHVIKLNGKLIPVSEEVYLAYYRSDRHARYLEEKDARHGVVHFSDLDTDEMTGEDMIPDMNAESIEDGVIQSMLFGQLRECLELLTSSERELIDALFFSNGGVGMTERECAVFLGLSKTALHARKIRVFTKLKNLFQNS
jgi:DNA-directed RNA polymerase specialized sigma24 family protein